MNTYDMASFRYLFKKPKGHIEMKPTSLEGELQTFFVACWRIDVTPIMDTRSEHIY
jgi:hypothetical protein